MMFRSIKDGLCASLGLAAKWKMPSLSVLVLVFATTLVAGVQPAPVFAAGLESWLQKQGDKIYQDTKKAIQDYSQPSKEADDSSEGQDAVAPQSQQTQTQFQSVDAPRYNKSWVTEIQTHLTRLGYNPGPVDGAFGNKSRIAISAFQQQRGLQVTGLPTPSVMQALQGASQAALSNPDPSINNPSPAAGGQTAATASSSIFYPMPNLQALANNAGEYAAWADACSDPAGVAVKSDLLSMLDGLTPDEKANIIQRFDKRYAQRKGYAEQRVKQCTAMGRTDCCTATKGTKGGKFHLAKMRYQRSLESTVAAATSSPVSQHYWGRFTRYGGQYAAWADACSDPAGVTVRSDLLSKADMLAPSEKAGVIQNFEKYYAFTKKKAEKFVKQCTAKGMTDCCTIGASNGREISRAKKYYQSVLKQFPVAAAAKKSSGSSTAIVAATPTSPTVSGASAATPAAVPTSPNPSGPAPASGPIPATPQALDILVSYASNYAGWAAACGEPVTVKQDYMAAANLLAPEYRDPRIKTFNIYYSGTFDRVKKGKDFFANPVSPSTGQLKEGAIDPCTKAAGDDYKKKYETALLAVQKIDADAKSAAAAKMKAKAEALSAASVPPRSSRIKKISKADLEPGAIQVGQLGSWGVTDGTIMACTGARDTMIRHNIMVMFEVVRFPEHHKERFKDQYDNGFTQYSKAPCGVGLPVTSVPPAEQAYAKYLKFQNYVLKCSAAIKTTPKGHNLKGC